MDEDDMELLRHDFMTGAVEAWWLVSREDQDEKERDLRNVRAAWSLAVGARVDIRRALEDQGFLQVDRSRAVMSKDRLLSTYTEIWVGREGTVTIDWNRDPTDPDAED